MAVAAAHRQRRGKQPHRPHEFVDGNPLQDLHVLEDLVGHLRPGRCWRLAGDERDRRRPDEEACRNRDAGSPNEKSHLDPLVG